MSRPSGFHPWRMTNAPTATRRSIKQQIAGLAQGRRPSRAQGIQPSPRAGARGPSVGASLHLLPP
ncbi:MAG: hypothetical protein AAFV59_17190, partial [Pseudomonadota bacterium]